MCKIIWFESEGSIIHHEDHLRYFPKRLVTERMFIAERGEGLAYS